MATSIKTNRRNGASVREQPNGSASGVTDLPDDLAANHDFYLHGTHKQQPRRGRWIPAGKALRRPTRAQTEAFNRKMDEFATEIEGLPADLAKNLDHYLHGRPKA
jgi:hypothetical protein